MVLKDKFNRIIQDVEYAIDRANSQYLEGWVASKRIKNFTDQNLQIFQNANSITSDAVFYRRPDVFSQMGEAWGFTIPISGLSLSSGLFVIKISTSIDDNQNPQTENERIEFHLDLAKDAFTSSISCDYYDRRQINGWAVFVESDDLSQFYAKSVDFVDEIPLRIGQIRKDLTDRYPRDEPRVFSLYLPAPLENCDEIEIYDRHKRLRFRLKVVLATDPADTNIDLFALSSEQITSIDMQWLAVSALEQTEHDSNSAFSSLRSPLFTQSPNVKKRIGTLLNSKVNELNIGNSTLNKPILSIDLHNDLLVHMDINVVSEFIESLSNRRNSGGKNISLVDVGTSARISLIRILDQGTNSHQLLISPANLEYLKADNLECPIFEDLFLNNYQKAQLEINSELGNYYSETPSGKQALSALIDICINELVSGYGWTFFSSRQRALLAGKDGVPGVVSSITFLANRYQLFNKGIGGLATAFRDLRKNGGSWYSNLPISHPLHSGDVSERVMELDLNATKNDCRRVTVIGTIDDFAGVGKNGMHSIKALKLAGIEHAVVPLNLRSPDWLEMASRMVIEDAGVALLHLQPDLICELFDRAHFSPDLTKIGFFAWESTSVPNNLKTSLDRCDAIWTPSNFCKEAFTKASKTPVHVAHHAVDVVGHELIDSRNSLGIDIGSFVIMYSFDYFSTLSRKNPAALLKLFKTWLKSYPDSLLLLRIRNYRNLVRDAQRGDILAQEFLDLLRPINDSVKIISTELTNSEYGMLVSSADVFLSLHRSEGFGYAIAEAMLAGVPTVSTGYSGNLDYQNSLNSYLVNWEPLQIDTLVYPWSGSDGIWAEPDIDHALDLLEAIRHGGSELNEKVKLAREDIIEKFSIQSMSNRYKELLDEMNLN